MKLNLKSKTLKFSISGLRGVYPKDINPENIPGIIEAYHKTLPAGPIAIGRDNRPTGGAIEDIVSGVLCSLGRLVYRLDICPTPTVKAFVKSNSLAGAIMISASHNPIEYNAFKFVKKDGLFFNAKDNDIFVKHLGGQASWGDHRKQGSIIYAKEKSKTQHIDNVLGKVKFPKLSTALKTSTKNKKSKKKSIKLKIGIDTLGACATDIAPELFNKMGISFVSLFPEIVYNFPRKPEPTPDALKKLGKFVVENKCNLGFAFDPDADRLALVDSSGQAIGEELTLPLAMMGALKERKGNVVVNLSSSYYNNFVAHKMGSKLFRSAVGEANVVELMKKKRAIFGGEGNGGVIDPEIDSFGRDSLSGIAWILKYLIKENKTLEEAIAELPLYHMKKIALPGDQKVFKQMAKQLATSLKGWKLSTIDGLHYSAPSGLPWIHLRASNTEPVIRVIAEAADKQELKKILNYIV